MRFYVARLVIAGGTVRRARIVGRSEDLREAYRLYEDLGTDEFSGKALLQLGEDWSFALLRVAAAHPAAQTAIRSLTWCSP